MDEPITPHKIIKLINSEFKIRFLYPLFVLSGFKLIKEFDNNSLNKKFKFGVIYMKKGQVKNKMIKKCLCLEYIILKI